MNRNGLSLIEVVVVLLLLAIVGGGFFAVVSQSQKQGAQTSAIGNAELEVLKAQKFIRRMGRVAYRCLVPNSAELHCEIDFESPPIGNRSWLRVVRLAGTSNELAYEKCSGSYDVTTSTCGGGWSRQTSYTGISDFVVCNTENVDDGSCPIVLDPSQPNIGPKTMRTKMVAPPVPNYFRFKVGAVTSPGGGQFVLQSAFCARNQDPIAPGFLFQWGS